MTAPLPVRWSLAVRAMAALSKDLGDGDAQHLFQVALDCRGLEGELERLKASREGARLLKERPLFRPDVTALLRRPPGSLGERLGAFYRDSGITPFNPRRPPDSDFEYLTARVGQTHDLWHVVLGLGPDNLGEVRILSFTFGQYRSFTGLIGALFNGLYLARAQGLRQLSRAFREGLRWFRFGRRFHSMAQFVWEDLLDLPLEEVRLRVGLKPNAPSIHGAFACSDSSPKRGP